jgi:hypothetical protein
LVVEEICKTFVRMISQTVNHPITHHMCNHGLKVT